MISKTVTRLLVLVSFSAVVGCNSGKDQDKYQIEDVQNSTEELQLSVTDTLSFTLDSLTSPKAWMYQFKLIGNVPYYFRVNSAINSLQAYNFKDQSVEKVIKFQKQGPDANLIIENFYFHNWDSIFFFSGDPNRVMLFDSTGQKKATWSIALSEEHEAFTITTQEYYFRPYFDRNLQSVGFWMFPPLSPHKKDYYRSSKAVEYNLAKNTYKAFGEYPENYLDDSGTHMVLCPINGYQTNQFNVLYYGASSNIYLYDKNTKDLVKVIDAKSRHLPDGVPVLVTDESENNATYEERVVYYLTTGCYEYMFSNEDFTYNYRIVKHPSNYKDEFGKVNSIERFEFSILIFDKDFKLINEVDFPGSTYDFRQSFAFGRNIYLNINNPLNKNIDEDHLYFEVHSLK